MNVNRLIVLLVLFLMFLFDIHAQRLFSCDSSLVSNRTNLYLIGECDIFFNYLKEQQDSIIVNDSFVKVTTEFELNAEYVKHGKVLYYYSKSSKKNKVILTGSFKEGQPHGKFVYYSGNDSFSVVFVNGKKHGEQIEYLRRLKTVKTYSNGVLNGPLYVIYNETGNYKEYRNYRNGKLVGGEFDYYPNGMLHFFNAYEDGKLIDGPCFIFNTNGTYFYKYTVKNGVIEGPQYRMDDNGNVEEVKIYKKGKWIGETYRLRDENTIEFYDKKHNSIRLIPRSKVKYFNEVK